MTRTPISSSTAGALPSLTELGLMLAVIAKREAGIDLINVGRGKPANEEQRIDWLAADLDQRTADHLLFTRIDALRSLISTLPAQTLSDCVVQINVAAHMAMKITGNDLEKPELDELSEALERILVSVLPVLAAAAGLDLVEFAFDEVADLHEARFPEMAA